MSKVQEEGNFIEEGGGGGGWFQLKGVLFIWRIPLFVEEGCVLSRGWGLAHPE